MRIFQHFVYLFARVLLLLYRIKTHEASFSVDSSKSYVVAVNHISKLDPYTSIGAISFRKYIKLRLFRFMTVNRYMVGFTGFVLRLSGAYPYKPLNDEPYGLEASKKYLNEGQTIVIFPEGGIVRPGVDFRIRSGVSVLAKEPNTLVLPIHIKYIDKNKPNKVFRNTKIIVGRPFDGSQMSAEEIMNKVYSL